MWVLSKNLLASMENNAGKKTRIANIVRLTPLSGAGCEEPPRTLRRARLGGGGSASLSCTAAPPPPLNPSGLAEARHLPGYKKEAKATGLWGGLHCATGPRPETDLPEAN